MFYRLASLVIITMRLPSLSGLKAAEWACVVRLHVVVNNIKHCYIIIPRMTTKLSENTSTFNWASAQCGEVLRDFYILVQPKSDVDAVMTIHTHCYYS